jgi:hypothetical protein
MRGPLTILALAVAVGCDAPSGDASPSPVASTSAAPNAAGAAKAEPDVRGARDADARRTFEAEAQRERAEAIATERALPSVDTSGWATMRNEAYDISARVPPGWTAAAGHSKVIDVDSWTLAGPSGRDGPRVTLLLARPPRKAHHNASFPGGLDGSEVDARRPVAGVDRPVTLLGGGAEVRGDFDTERVAVTFKAHADAPADRAAVRAILEHLRVGP